MTLVRFLVIHVLLFTYFIGIQIPGDYSREADMKVWAHFPKERNQVH